MHSFICFTYFGHYGFLLISLGIRAYDTNNAVYCLYLTEKYDHVGRLLKPGEEPRDYSDTEDEPSSSEKSKDA